MHTQYYNIICLINCVIAYSAARVLLCSRIRQSIVGEKTNKPTNSIQIVTRIVFDIIGARPVLLQHAILYRGRTNNNNYDNGKVLRIR